MTYGRLTLYHTLQSVRLRHPHVRESLYFCQSVGPFDYITLADAPSGREINVCNPVHASRQS